MVRRVLVFVAHEVAFYFADQTILRKSKKTLLLETHKQIEKIHAFVANVQRRVKRKCVCSKLTCNAG